MKINGYATKLAPEDIEYIRQTFLKYRNSPYEPVQALLKVINLDDPKGKDLHIAETIEWFSGIYEIENKSEE